MATILIQLPDQTAQQLRKQAAAAGKRVEQLASEVLQAQATASQSLRQISGVVFDQFQSLDISDEQLADQLEREDHASRGVDYDD